jgi:hypothetical protein
LIALGFPLHVCAAPPMVTFERLNGRTWGDGSRGEAQGGSVYAVLSGEQRVGLIANIDLGVWLLVLDGQGRWTYRRLTDAKMDAARKFDGRA